ncbi:MAG: glycosyltransferase family 2 protein [Flavobacteriales bacterium]|nr:glycosyltransferase family 2 protein [Flavobacteriales bacterium]
MNQEVAISIVIPVFNAAETLVELNHQIVSFMNKEEYSYEVIYVDDRSSDGSWKILSELQKNTPKQIKIIRFIKNFGQHEATMCGMLHATGQNIITMDDDLEHNVDDIEELITCKKETNAKVVYGMYPNDESQRVRKILTRFYRFVSKAEGENKAKGSSFRLLDVSIVQHLKKHEYSFVWLDEMFLWYTPTPKFVDLKLNENNKGRRSRYSLFRLIRLTFHIMLHTTTIPLQLLITLGFGMSLLNFVIGGYYLFKKVFLGAQLGFTSIIVSILFTSGIILIGIGILGIYISRINSIVNREPHYSIDEKKC